MGVEVRHPLLKYADELQHLQYDREDLRFGYKARIDVLLSPPPSRSGKIGTTYDAFGKIPNSFAKRLEIFA